MTYRLLVTAPSACFRRPEFAADDVSYDVITPAAARRVFEAIHWTPDIWWRVDRIVVLHPIRSGWRDRSDGAMARPGRALCLIDVSYLLVARFTVTHGDAPADAARHAAMFKRRARSHRFFRPPTLGGREWPATTRLVEPGETFASAHANREAVDLGWMLFDRDREDRERLRYYRPVMHRGVIDLTTVDVSGLPT